MALLNMNQAMKSIKDEQCCECRRKAKGLVYSQEGVRYYCKKCLHEYMQTREMHPQVAEASTA